MQARISFEASQAQSVASSFRIDKERLAAEQAALQQQEQALDQQELHVQSVAPQAKERLAAEKAALQNFNNIFMRKRSHHRQPGYFAELKCAVADRTEETEIAEREIQSLAAFALAHQSAEETRARAARREAQALNDAVVASAAAQHLEPVPSPMIRMDSEYERTFKQFAQQFNEEKKT